MEEKKIGGNGHREGSQLRGRGSRPQQRGQRLGGGGRQGLPALLPPALIQLKAGSVPDFQEAVPGAGGYSHAVVRHAQAADPVVVASEDPWKERELIAMEKCPEEWYRGAQSTPRLLL